MKSLKIGSTKSTTKYVCVWCAFCCCCCSSPLSFVHFIRTKTYWKSMEGNSRKICLTHIVLFPLPFRNAHSSVQFFICEMHFELARSTIFNHFQKHSFMRTSYFQSGTRKMNERMKKKWKETFRMRRTYYYNHHLEKYITLSLEALRF